MDTFNCHAPKINYYYLSGGRAGINLWICIGTTYVDPQILIQCTVSWVSPKVSVIRIAPPKVQEELYLESIQPRIVLQIPRYHNYIDWKKPDR